MNLTTNYFFASSDYLILYFSEVPAPQKRKTNKSYNNAETLEHPQDAPDLGRG